MTAPIESFLRLIVVLLVILLSGCASSLTPLSHLSSAQSLAAGKTELDLAVLPRPYISATVGITDRWDAGIEFDEISTIRSRYTFIQKNDGFSLAQTAGLYYGENHDAVEEGTYSTGAYLGLIGSWNTSDSRNGVSAEIRYLNTQYPDFTGESRGGILPSSYTWYYDDRGGSPRILSEDLRHIIQLNLLFTFEHRSHSIVQLGALCQFNVSEENIAIPSGRCGPALALSFKRR